MRIVNYKRFTAFILVCVMAFYGLLCLCAKVCPQMFEPSGAEWTYEEWVGDVNES